MTLAEMQRSLTDELNRADVPVPSPDRLVALLNRAKTLLAREMETANSDLFTTRQSYSLSAGTASQALPTDFVRLIGLTRTDLGDAIEVPVIDTRERDLYQNRTNLEWMVGQAIGRDVRVPVAYIESATLYFVEPLPAAVTLLLRYRKRPADLTTASGSSSYDIPVEWHDLVVDMAAENAIPAANAEYAKVAGRVASQKAMLYPILTQRANDAPRTIRRVC